MTEPRKAMKSREEVFRKISTVDEFDQVMALFLEILDHRGDGLAEGLLAFRLLPAIPELPSDTRDRHRSIQVLRYLHCAVGLELQHLRQVHPDGLTDRNGAVTRREDGLVVQDLGGDGRSPPLVSHGCDESPRLP